MSLVQLRPEAPDAGVAHLVERHLAKVEVASSSLVTRSKQKRNVFVAFLFFIKIRCRGQVVRQRSAKPSFPSSNLGGTSKRRASALQMLFFRLPLPFAAQDDQIADRKKDNQKESPLLNFVPVLYSMDFS